MSYHHRAGRYIKQSTGYSAFIPAPLPPADALRYDDEMLSLISRADLALGRLDGSIQTLPDADLFVFMYVRKEAVLSSQIEGTQSSLNDLLEAEAKILSPHRPRDVGEVLNYVNAMSYGIKRLAELPFSIRLTKEIHARLLEGVRGAEYEPGEVRRSQNWIGPSGCTLTEATFVPPPPSELVQALSDLEKFVHAKDAMPALVKIGLIHAQFETIHPFLDDNGRMGRLLISFLLFQSEILLKPVLYLSHYFKQHRQRYYDLLQNVRDNGDWEIWLKFFLTAVSEVSLEATETARQIVALREHHRRCIVDSFGRATANGLTVLESLYSQPIITVKNIANMTGVSFTAANKLMNRFVEEKILIESTGQARNRQFRYTDYINLFASR